MCEHGKWVNGSTAVTELEVEVSSRRVRSPHNRRSRDLFARCNTRGRQKAEDYLPALSTVDDDVEAVPVAHSHFFDQASANATDRHRATRTETHIDAPVDEAISAPLAIRVEDIGPSLQRKHESIGVVRE